MRVDEIAERFGVSRETIRRDLAQLDARQLLRRVHGGAEPPRAGIEAAFSQRLTENADAKARIGKAAAALFEDNDTLMIDTGSTTEAFAAALGARGRFSVVTNSAGVAWHLYNAGSASRIYLIGGEYRGETGETVGSVAIDQVARFRADHAVLTLGGARCLRRLHGFRRRGGHGGPGHDRPGPERDPSWRTDPSSAVSPCTRCATCPPSRASSPTSRQSRRWRRRSVAPGST